MMDDYHWNRSKMTRKLDHCELAPSSCRWRRRRQTSGQVYLSTDKIKRKELPKKLTMGSNVIECKLEVPSVRRSKLVESNNSIIAMLIFIVLFILCASEKSIKQQQVEALQITNFRVPAFVPTSLGARDELAKPILFDCDYEYAAHEDARLTVRWFKNKEPEPFYQWLPELQRRHFADWIKPLINQSFVSDPQDPLKRFRSLLIKRLSMNLTGQYTCVVSSLAGQDARQANLVVYQPPRTFTFEHSIFPAPAGLLQTTGSTRERIESAAAGSPTQFKSGGQTWPVAQQATIVRPANNNQLQAGGATPTPLYATPSSAQNSTKIVYTHDGRPIRRKSRRDTTRAQQDSSGAAISGWQLRKKLGGDGAPLPVSEHPQQQQQHSIQLHHFQCRASQLTPRPMILLTVKRDAEAIAQYLHESSMVSIRPYQVSEAYLFSGGNNTTMDQSPTLPPAVTLYDITVSATVALNVSLPSRDKFAPEPRPAPFAATPPPAPIGVHTILNFRRGQRMSFECHLEITGTEFEQRKRYQISEEEVYQFAEAEEERRKLRQLQQQQQEFSNQQQSGGRNRAASQWNINGASDGTRAQNDGVGGLLDGLVGSFGSNGAGSDARPSHWLLMLTLSLVVVVASIRLNEQWNVSNADSCKR